MKRILAIILVAALCLGLVGCGKNEVGSYTVLERIGTKQYATIYRSNDVISDLVEACLSALAASGSLGRISTKWLGSDYIEIAGNTAALSEVEIPAERVLIIGVDTDAPPFAFMSGENIEGFSVDIANAIGSYLGWTVKIIPVKSADIATQLASGNIDCALCFAPECVDSTKFTLGEVLMESDIVIAVPEDSNVKNIRRIRGERIGTISDPALEKAISEHDKITKHSDGATVYVTPPRCISAMEKGWCVAIVMDILMLEAYSLGTYVYVE